MDAISFPLVWAAQSQHWPATLPILALRRWFTSLTWFSPEPRPYPIWIWLGSLVVLLLWAMAVQGPRHALGQFFGIAGLFRLLGKASTRLQNAWRLTSACLGCAVLSWTSYQLFMAENPEGLNDLNLIRIARGLGWGSVLDHALLAGLAPLRDLIGLADMIPLEIGLAIVLSVKLAQRWNTVSFLEDGERTVGLLPLFCWAGVILHVLYQASSRLGEPSGLPLGGLNPLEALAIPLFTLFSDSLVLAWILVETRNAGLRRIGGSPFDLNGWMALLPGSMLTCVFLMPGRYLGYAIVLAGGHFKGLISGSRLVWLLIGLHGVGLIASGFLGSIVWARGRSFGHRNLGRLMRAEGGRLASFMALLGILAAVFSGLSYGLFFSIPAQPWLLLVADGYAHYATLVVGLIGVAGIVELGERSLPSARRVVTRARTEEAVLR